MSGGDGTHCLLGWRREVFGSFHTTQSLKVQDAVTSEILEEVEGDLCEVEFNDRRRTSRAIIARVWNRAMKRLGYDVPKKYL